MMHRDDIIFAWTRWVKNQILFFFINYFQTLKSDVKDVIFQSRKKVQVQHSVLHTKMRVKLLNSFKHS